MRWAARVTRSAADRSFFLVFRAYIRLLFVSDMKKGGFTPPNGGVKLPFCQLLLRQFFFQAGEDFFLFARDLDLRQTERLGGLLLGVFPIETENHDFSP